MEVIGDEGEVCRFAAVQGPDDLRNLHAVLSRLLTEAGAPTTLPSWSALADIIGTHANDKGCPRTDCPLTLEGGVLVSLTPKLAEHAVGMDRFVDAKNRLPADCILRQLAQQQSPGEPSV